MLTVSYETAHVSYETENVSHEMFVVSYETAKFSYETASVSYEKFIISYETVNFSHEITRRDVRLSLSFTSLYLDLRLLPVPASVPQDRRGSSF